MLHPFAYRQFCLHYVNRVINHDDTIPETKLENYVEDTDKAWKKRNDKRKEAEEELRNWKPPQPVKQESIIPVAAIAKPTGLKSKIKSILSRKNKVKNVRSTPIPASYSYYNSIFNDPLVPPIPKNGYLDKKYLLIGNFREGKFNAEEEDLSTTTETGTDGEEEKVATKIKKSAIGDEEKLPAEINDNTISDQEVLNEKAVDAIDVTSELPSLKKTIVKESEAIGSEKNDTEAIKVDKNDIIYDKENISYHDKSKKILMALLIC